MLVLSLATASARAQSGSQTMSVRYRIFVNPEVPAEGEAWRLSLGLRAADSGSQGIGWEVERVSLRRPGQSTVCDDFWVDSSPIVDTTDGLWWIDHADPQQPELAEFLEPPHISGLAAIESGGATQELEYWFAASGLESQSAGTAYLDYWWRLDGEDEPEDEGDEEPVGPDSSGDDVPMAVPGFDVNHDGRTDGEDVQPFVDACLAGCDFDVHRHVPCFVAALLNEPCPDIEADCNNNGLPDASDILLHVSDDCDTDGVPDECQIAADAGLDIDGDGVLDACEPDCNGNDRPDDDDLVQNLSQDCDGNGVPDECDMDCDGNGVPDACDIDPADPDGDLWVDPDCNQNGVVDACDDDCNGNGVPDDCDIDPTDPDGDNVVWADCNGNLWPDVCDLTIPPPLGSLDCNGNDVPDECDIAACEGDPACGDCNENGIPDACDIAAQISQDVDEDGVPDECQNNQFMMSGFQSSTTSGGDGETGGGDSGEYSTSGATGGGEWDAVWAEYDAWIMGQTWGPDSPFSGPEQFLRLVQKRIELGLPLNERW